MNYKRLVLALMVLFIVAVSFNAANAGLFDNDSSSSNSNEPCDYDVMGKINMLSSSAIEIMDFNEAT